MQLLKITNIPAQFKMDVEPARLQVNSSAKMQQDIVQRQGQMRIKAEDTKVRIDTTAMRESLNLRSPLRFAAYNAARGEQAIKQTTTTYSREGFEMSQAQKGTDIKDIQGQTFFPDPAPTLITTFMPQPGPEMSWQPAQLDLNYAPGEAKVSWKDIKRSMEYIPGKISMEVTQRPKVEIEYLGSPNYVPKSADPTLTRK